MNVQQRVVDDPYEQLVKLREAVRSLDSEA